MFKPLKKMMGCNIYLPTLRSRLHVLDVLLLLRPHSLSDNSLEGRLRCPPNTIHERKVTRTEYDTHVLDRKSQGMGGAITLRR